MWVKQQGVLRTQEFGIGLTITSEWPFLKPKRSILFAANDWAEIGVEPDVKVRAPDALVTAEKLAQDKLQEK